MQGLPTLQRHFGIHGECPETLQKLLLLEDHRLDPISVYDGSVKGGPTYSGGVGGQCCHRRWTGSRAIEDYDSYHRQQLCRRRIARDYA